MEEVRQAVVTSIGTENSAFQIAGEGLSQFDDSAAALGAVAVAMDGIIEQIRGAKEKAEKSSGTYKKAIEEAEKATDQLSGALASSVTAEAAAAIGAYASSRDSLDDTDGRIQAAVEDIEGLVEKAYELKNAIDSKQTQLEAISAEASADQPEKLSTAVAAAEAASAVM